MNVLDRLKYECEYGRRDLLLALADEAEERGEGVLASGYRWMAEWGKWPAGKTLENYPSGHARTFWWNKQAGATHCSSLEYDVVLLGYGYQSEYEAVYEGALAIGWWLRRRSEKKESA